MSLLYILPSARAESKPLIMFYKRNQRTLLRVSNVFNMSIVEQSVSNWGEGERERLAMYDCYGATKYWDDIKHCHDLYSSRYYFEGSGKHMRFEGL